ncbi:MAG: serine/threonine-protein kinase [Dokdonella sp.]
MNRLDRLLEPGRLLRGALVNSLLRESGHVTELAIGQSLGPFRIERELGRGGMGIVYLAARADGEYEHEVAIKWLPSGALDPDHLDQFRRERQILAQLSHPNIARLLDGGHCDGGQLWFAMEHVEGLPIDRHAAELGLGWRDRVGLILPVVEAVLFAHGRLLVHRDIKPNNVLVDSDGRPKLLDFGVASLLSDAQARLAFTPGFASPEQRSGARPDVASDVWQLGRLLQVMLAAKAPGSAAPQVPRDLGAILAKATEGSSLRRYPTASALLADLQRVLHFRPVAARPPNMPHRLHLLLQAHPWVSLGSALVSLVFAAVVVGFMLNLAGQRDEAEHARAVAVAVNNFLNNDLLPGIDPLQDGSSDITAFELTVRALEKVEHLQGVPEVAGQLDLSLGRSLSNLGRFDLSMVALDRAIARLTQAYGPHHVDVLTARLARDQADLNEQLVTDEDQRLQSLRKDVLTSLGPKAPLLEDVDVQSAHVAMLRDDFVLCEARYSALLPRIEQMGRANQADVYNGLSMCESRLGRLESALKHARKAHELRVQENGPHHPFALETGLSLETALVGLGQYDEAIVVLHDLNAELAHRYGEHHPTTLTVTHDLGFAITCAGRAEEGAVWLRKAVDGRALVLGRNHPWYAMSEAVLSMALIREGHLQEANAELSTAEAVLATHPGETPYAQAVTLENRADLMLAQHRYAEAIKRFDTAIEAATPLYPAEHPRLAVMRLGRGLAMLGAHATEEGKVVLRDALHIIGDRPDCRSNQIDDARRLLE